MRKKMAFLVACCALSGLSLKAQLTIDSASFVVQTGAEVDVTGDLTSAKGLPEYGKFVFDSPTDSQSVNMNGNFIPNAEIDNSSGIWLTGDLGISTTLVFTNGIFHTGNHNFSLADVAAVSGMGSGKFIATDGTGQVIKDITSNLSSYEVPVGAGIVYRPVFLTTTGSNSGAVVGILNHGSASSSLPPSTSDYLKSNWTVTQTGIGGTLNVTAQYSDPADVSGTEGNLRAYLFDGTDWSSATGTINTTANTVSFPITIASSNITAIDKFDVLKAKVFLQGAYNPTSHLMSDNLRAAGLIPVSDPYRVSPYNGAFTEVNDNITETADASVFTDQTSQNDNIVDWVFLELRSADGATVLQTRSALLQRDGDIVDVDGKSAVTFNNISSADYTIVIRHRNHLGLSTDPSSYTPMISEKQSTAPLIDFTSSAFLYGGTSAHGTATDGNYVLWGGNANLNSNVKYTGIQNDKDYIYVNVLGSNPANVITNVYSPADLNLDGKVSYNGIGNDKDYLYNNILGSSPAGQKTESLP